MAVSGYFLHFSVNAPCRVVDTPSILQAQKDLEPLNVCPSLKWLLSYVDLCYK